MSHMKSILLIVLVLFSGFVLANPVIYEHEETYSILGNSAEDLRTQMNRHGPHGNGQYHASTEWHVIWHYQLHENTNSCIIKNPEITVDIKYFFPEWENYASGTVLLQKRWDITLKQLRTHEYQHGKNGQLAGVAIKKTLQELPTMDNCEQIEAAVKKNTDSIIEHYQELDVKLDAETKHGTLS